MTALSRAARHRSDGSAPAYLRACRVTDIPLAGALTIDVAGEPVALVRTNDAVYAVHDVCSHAEVPLSQGEVAGCTIECWLHGSRFDLRTGRPIGAPATQPVATYPVLVEDGEVFVGTTPSCAF
jgi:3-phenylpropionate/trans-cinnamate dioxygenase ferredoxin subunit